MRSLQIAGVSMSNWLVCAKCERFTDVVCVESQFKDWCQECVAEVLEQ